MPLGPEAIERLRLQLLERRHALIRSSRRGQQEIDALKDQETGAEMEEDAQSSAAQFVLTSLSGSQLQEVQQIDAALDRMDAGTYGICVDCGNEISEQRLRAVPYAVRDAGCASQLETRESGVTGYPSL